VNKPSILHPRNLIIAATSQGELGLLSEIETFDLVNGRASLFPIIGPPSGTCLELHKHTAKLVSGGKGLTRMLGAVRGVICAIFRKGAISFDAV
jgi:hypothetical protein